jgi:Putative DNA-binding domain
LHVGAHVSPVADYGFRHLLKLETRAQLEALHSGLMKESLTLEYKSSGAVDKTQPKKEEIAKDALAFANAAGGQIVYGMKENGNLPEGLDGGIDPLQFPGIWFEQVIQQNVSLIRKSQTIPSDGKLPAYLSDMSSGFAAGSCGRGLHTSVPRIAAAVMLLIIVGHANATQCDSQPRQAQTEGHAGGIDCCHACYNGGYDGRIYNH